jgi:hypothetical protein
MLWERFKNHLVNLFIKQEFLTLEKLSSSFWWELFLLLCLLFSCYWSAAICSTATVRLRLVRLQYVRQWLFVCDLLDCDVYDCDCLAATFRLRFVRLWLFGSDLFGCLMRSIRCSVRVFEISFATVSFASEWIMFLSERLIVSSGKFIFTDSIFFFRVKLQGKLYCYNTSWILLLLCVNLMICSLFQGKL